MLESIAIAHQHSSDHTQLEIYHAHDRACHLFVSSRSNPAQRISTIIRSIYTVKWLRSDRTRSLRDACSGVRPNEQRLAMCFLPRCWAKLQVKGTKKSDWVRHCPQWDSLCNLLGTWKRHSFGYLPPSIAKLFTKTCSSIIETWIHQVPTVLCFFFACEKVVFHYSVWWSNRKKWAVCARLGSLCDPRSSWHSVIVPNKSSDVIALVLENSEDYLMKVPYVNNSNSPSWRSENLATSTRRQSEYAIY